MNNRRKLLVALGAGTLLAPLRLLAQRTAGVARVGILSTGSLQDWELASLRRGLSERGWNEGQNLVLDVRSAMGDLEKLADLAAALARGSQLIVSATTPATRVAMKATKSLPIVMVGVGDPVGTGLVKSLSHPGGNVTGVTNIASDLTSKRLSLLKETIPAVKRIAVMFHPDDPITAPQRRDIEPAAKTLGVQLKFVAVRGNDELDRAFEQITGGRAEAVIRLAGQANAVSKRTAELALKHRLPAMMLTSQDVEAGGLMSYWTDHVEHYRQAAAYVDRILKGAKPADLPVEQPTKFEMAINMKTARALGIKIPDVIMLRADKVIE